MDAGGWLFRIATGCCGVMLLAVVGCSGHTEKGDVMINAYRSCNYALAVPEAQLRVEKSAGSHNELIWLLEAGTVARAAGEYALSNELYEQADAIVTHYESQPPISIKDETGAMVTNQAQLTYRGRAYDAIMLNTYKALNCMQLGDLDGARVELNRAYERQRQAVEANAKRIAKAEEEAAEEKDKYDAEQAKADPKFQADYQEAYGDLEDPGFDETYSAYTNYVNPLTEFVQALYFMAAAVDASDLERGVHSMQRVAGMSDQNTFIKEDVALADSAANGTPLPPITYVVFETGMAPYRKTIRIDIPVFIAGKYSGGVDYVGAAFPRLAYHDDYLANLQVATVDGQVATQLLCSMDAVVKRDFKNELPTVITKTLISTGIKAGAAYGVNMATRNDEVVNIIARVGTGLYQVAMNQADERTWMTLPKQFQYCRFYTPGDAAVTIIDPATAGPHTVQLDPDKVNVVWVKSNAPGSPLGVSHFTLP